MKATPHTLANLRSLIRWTTGAVVTTGIISGTMLLFPPLGSSVPALGLTGFLAVFIGLKIALPPICPEDDWVCIGTTSRQAAEEEASMARAQQPSAETRQMPEPVTAAAQTHLQPVNRSDFNPAPAKRVANGDLVSDLYKFDSPLWRLVQAQNARQQKSSSKLSHN